jgi:type IV secretory pathway VirB6-like protein
MDNYQDMKPIRIAKKKTKARKMITTPPGGKAKSQASPAQLKALEKARAARKKKKSK